jgi:hypothetical protein
MYIWSNMKVCALSPETSCYSQHFLLCYPHLPSPAAETRDAHPLAAVREFYSAGATRRGSQPGKIANAKHNTHTTAGTKPSCCH